MTQTAPFAGKSALVTGAASGIGRASALRLAQGGALVIATDVDEEGCRSLVAEVRAAGGAARAIAADILDQDWDRRVLDFAGEVDLLANVAGILDGYRPVDEIDDDLWSRVFGVNVTAPMRLTRGVLPAMVKRGRGAIVNVSSIAGISGTGGGAAYVSSKHALVGLTRNTAKMYYRDGVRCNAVAPGGTLTGIDLSMPSARGRASIEPFIGIIPPMAQASEIAAAVCWLLSDDASNINGAVLTADGGWSIL